MGGVQLMFEQRHYLRSNAQYEKYHLNQYPVEARRRYMVFDLKLAKSSHLAGDDCSIADIVPYSWVALWQWRELDWSRGAKFDTMVCCALAMLCD